MMTDAAEQGYALAQWHLGVMYHFGQGVPQSDALAVEWWRKAADQGHAHAQYNLGFMYDDGKGGLPQSDALAVEWYRKAADQGVAHAQSNLGVMYRHNISDAMALDGTARPQTKDMHRRSQSRSCTIMAGVGCLQSDALAVAWFRKAADQGYAHAQYNLGTQVP